MWKVAGIAQGDCAEHNARGSSSRSNIRFGNRPVRSHSSRCAVSGHFEVSPIDLREQNQIERTIATFAQSPNGGLILAASGIGATNVNLVITAAARYKVPAVYPVQTFVAAGGLISYGPNFTDQYRRAAGYVDRILRGEKPADLPVQAPNKYELAINVKTAKALGLSVPQSLLARADEVIE